MRTKIRQGRDAYFRHVDVMIKKAYIFTNIFNRYST